MSGNRRTFAAKLQQMRRPESLASRRASIQSNASELLESYIYDEIPHPIDFEPYIMQQKHNDKLVITDIDFPVDDISIERIDRSCLDNVPNDACSVVKDCVAVYQTPFCVVTRNYVNDDVTDANAHHDNELVYEDDLTASNVNSTTDLLTLPELEDISIEGYSKHLTKSRSKHQVDHLLNLVPFDKQSIFSTPAEPAQPSKPFRFQVHCSAFNLEPEIEGIWLSIGIYDASRKCRLSETWYVASPGSCANYEVSKMQLNDIFLVVRLEKMLQPDGDELYLRNNSNISKDEIRRLREIQNTFKERLGSYRMPLAWTAVNLATVLTDGGVVPFENDFKALCITLTNFYREDSNNSDFDLYRNLLDTKRTKKFKCIPGVLTLQLSPATQKEALVEMGAPIYPHLTYKNNLFVYPISLNFSSTSLRNICVKVEYYEVEHRSPLDVWSGQCATTSQNLIRERHTSILYHNKVPQWHDEFKAFLPLNASSKHHLLFTFMHISCTAKKQQAVVSVGGYSWLPIFTPDGRLISGEYCLPISAEKLTPGYSKTVPSPAQNLHWIDNSQGKGLFTVIIKPHSSVTSSDPYINRFLTLSGDMLEGIQSTTTHNLALEGRLRQSVLEVADAECGHIILSLYSILSRLFRLICAPLFFDNGSRTLDLSHQAFESLVNIIQRVHGSTELDSINRSKLLMTYVYYIFDEPNFERGVVYQRRCVFEAVIIQWITHVGPISESLLMHSWFFYQIIIKSMWLSCGSRERIRRFSTDQQDDVSSIMSNIANDISARLSKGDSDAIRCTSYLAHFISDLLSVMNRGFVFSLIRNFMQALTYRYLTSSDLSLLLLAKLEFLRVLTCHEHFVLLALPFSGLSCTTNISPRSSICSSQLSGWSNSTYNLANGANALSPEFRQNHFIVALIIQEIGAALKVNLPHVHKKALELIIDLFVRIDNDERFSRPSIRCHIASLFLPLVLTAIRHQKNMAEPPPTEFNDKLILNEKVANAIAGIATDDNNESSDNEDEDDEENAPILSVTSTRLLLLSSLWILSSCNADQILTWCDSEAVLDLLAFAVDVFEWRSPTGKQRLEAAILGGITKRASLHKWDRNSWRISVNNEEDFGEKLLCTQAVLYSLDVVDTIGISNEASLKILTNLMLRRQSTQVLVASFGLLRFMIYKNSNQSVFTSDLCLALLYHSASLRRDVRASALAALYVLLRNHFEVFNSLSKVQLAEALSTLVSTRPALCQSRLHGTLSMLNTYTNNDVCLRVSVFAKNINRLVTQLCGVVEATEQLQACGDDYDRRVDLMHRIASAHKSSPRLRLAWLRLLRDIHLEKGFITEAALCCVHRAALMSEHMRRYNAGRHLPIGAVAFESISINILEESAIEQEYDETGDWTNESTFKSMLYEAAKLINKAGLFEYAIKIYHLLLPLLNHKEQADVYEQLRDCCNNIVNSKHRLFASYFRVKFLGSVFGPEFDEAEYIYRQPPTTKLSEMSELFEKQLSDRFGPEGFQIIKDSGPVDRSTLSSEIAHVQITFVEPYFEYFERLHRINDIEKNFEIQQFYFSTPFTQSGKPHGDIGEQFKRKTILTTATNFPYITTRIPVVSRREIIMSPLAVAIEDIEKKTSQLENASTPGKMDAKMLGMHLSGCIGTMVNQGIVEVAFTFLRVPDNLWTAEHNLLRLALKGFCRQCSVSLKLNKQLIKPDQKEGQKQLEKLFVKMQETLGPLLEHRYTITPH